MCLCYQEDHMIWCAWWEDNLFVSLTGITFKRGSCSATKAWVIIWSSKCWVLCVYLSRWTVPHSANYPSFPEQEHAQRSTSGPFSFLLTTAKLRFSTQSVWMIFRHSPRINEKPVIHSKCFLKEGQVKTPWAFLWTGSHLLQRRKKVGGSNPPGCSQALRNSGLPSDNLWSPNGHGSFDLCTAPILPYAVVPGLAFQRDLAGHHIFTREKLPRGSVALSQLLQTP